MDALARRTLPISAAVFALVGALMCLYGLNAFFLSRTDPTHWDWLTAGDHFPYFARHWRWVGAIAMGLGAQTVVLARTAFRRAERWAWWTLWYWPALAVLGILEYPWSAVFFGPLAVVLAAALVLPHRAFFPRAPRAAPDGAGDRLGCSRSVPSPCYLQRPLPSAPARSRPPMAEPAYRIDVEEREIVVRVRRDVLGRDEVSRFLDYLELESIRRRSELSEADAAVLADEVDAAVRK